MHYSSLISDFEDRFVPKPFAARIPIKTRFSNKNAPNIHSNKKFVHQIDSISSANRFHNNLKKVLGPQASQFNNGFRSGTFEERKPPTIYTFDYQGTTSLQSPFNFPKKTDYHHQKANWFTEDLKNIKLAAPQRPFRASQPYPTNDDPTIVHDSYLPEQTTRQNRLLETKETTIKPKTKLSYSHSLSEPLLLLNSPIQQTYKFDFNNAITSSSYANVDVNVQRNELYTTSAPLLTQHWKSTLKLKSKSYPTIAVDIPQKTTAAPTITPKTTAYVYVTKASTTESTSDETDDSVVSFSHNLKSFLSRPEDVGKSKLTFIDYAKMYFHDKTNKKPAADTNATLSYSFNLQDYLKAQNIYENTEMVDDNKDDNVNEISSTSIGTSPSSTTTQATPIVYVTTTRPRLSTVATTRVTRMFRRKMSTATDTCEMACLRNIINQEYNPVCGSDNKTYTNKGKFRCASICGQQIGLQIQHVGICVAGMANNTTLIV